MNHRTKGSTAYSLESAAKELCLRNEHYRSVAPPVDILGVVTDYFDVAVAKSKRCLRIVDASCSAFVTVQFSDDQTIGIGDIIRFNRVALRKQGRHYYTKTCVYGDDDNIAHFCHLQIGDPEAGPAWFCLGHVNHVDGSVTNKTPKELIPESMKTDADTLAHLVNWYVTSDDFQARSPLLSQLPHRPRTIEEMLSCVGSTGEIVANVVQVVDPPPFSVASSFFPSSKKRKRRTPANPMGYAVLSGVGSPQCSRHLVTLLDPEKRFLSTLRNANDSKCSVRICHVLSQKANQLDVRPRGVHVDDAVLLLTKASRVTLLSRCEMQEDVLQQIPSASWRGTPTMSLTATQTGTCFTQHHSLRIEGYIVSINREEADDDASNSKRTRNYGGTLGVKESIVDILLRSTGNSSGCSFRLVLSGTGMDREKIVVTANYSILWKLCGGCRDCSGNMAMLDKSSAEAFLHALLSHKTKLNWELQRCNNEWDVVGVSLKALNSMAV